MAKVAAVIVLQYTNYLNGKPINILNILLQLNSIAKHVN